MSPRWLAPLHNALPVAETPVLNFLEVRIPIGDLGEFLNNRITSTNPGMRKLTSPCVKIRPGVLTAEGLCPIVRLYGWMYGIKMATSYRRGGIEVPTVTP